MNNKLAQETSLKIRSKCVSDAGYNHEVATRIIAEALLNEEIQPARAAASWQQEEAQRQIDIMQAARPREKALAAEIVDMLKDENLSQNKQEWIDAVEKILKEAK